MGKNKLLSIKENSTLLDAGCGTQRYKKYCSHLKYYGQDFGKYEPSTSSEGLQMESWEYGELSYTGNIWDINEQNNHFDVILCTEVLEHIPYPDKAIAEFSRLLKTEGDLFLIAPFTKPTTFSAVLLFRFF